MSASLVGSEMCIRDSKTPARRAHFRAVPPASYEQLEKAHFLEGSPIPVSYTHLTLPTICSV
eukprot:6445061-Alexandrium_andersonii.AAC.1